MRVGIEPLSRTTARAIMLLDHFSAEEEQELAIIRG